MRSSPSFYTNPCHSFRRSLLFVCLSLSLVTANRLDGATELAPSLRSPRSPCKKTGGEPDHFIQLSVNRLVPDLSIVHQSVLHSRRSRLPRHSKRELPPGPTNPSSTILATNSTNSSSTVQTFRPDDSKKDSDTNVTTIIDYSSTKPNNVSDQPNLVHHDILNSSLSSPTQSALTSALDKHNSSTLFQATNTDNNLSSSSLNTKSSNQATPSSTDHDTSLSQSAHDVNLDKNTTNSPSPSVSLNLSNHQTDTSTPANLSTSNTVSVNHNDTSILLKDPHEKNHKLNTTGPTESNHEKPNSTDNSPSASFGHPNEIDHKYDSSVSGLSSGSGNSQNLTILRSSNSSGIPNTSSQKTSGGESGTSPLSSPTNVSSFPSKTPVRFGSKSTDGITALNITANHTGADLLNRTLGDGHTVSASLTDLHYNKTGHTGSHGDTDVSIDNPTSFNLTANHTSGVLTPSTLQTSDRAAAALASLDKNRTSTTTLVPTRGVDNTTNQVSSLNTTFLPSATSAGFGGNSAKGLTTFNLTGKNTSGVLTPSTLQTSDRAAAALASLDKNRTSTTTLAPAGGVDSTTNQVSSLNATFLPSATSAGFGGNSAKGLTTFNLTGNPTSSVLTPSTLQTSDRAAAALASLDKNRTSTTTLAPTGGVDSTTNQVPSLNATFLPSATSAGFGGNSAKGLTTFNLTGKNTSSVLPDSTLQTSDRAAAALASLDKNRTEPTTLASSGEGNGEKVNASSEVPSFLNVTSLPSATSANFEANSTDGLTTFNIPGNHTGGDLLNSAIEKSDAATVAFNQLNKSRTGDVAHVPGELGGSIEKALSHLDPSQNISSLPATTGGISGHNLTNGVAFNVTGIPSTGVLLNDSFDGGVAAALSDLNKTRNSGNGTDKSLGSWSATPVNVSDLRAPAAGSGFAITLPNTTLGTPTYNTTNSAGFFNSSNLSLNESASLAANSRSFNSTHDSQFVSGLPHNLTLASNTTGPNQTAVNRTIGSPIAFPSAAPAFVPVSTLFVNPASRDISPPTYTSNTTIDTPKPTKPEPPAPFPAIWPRYIVPSNTPTSPPENTTLISILFSNSLNWPWLVTNSNASSQVLVFMPALVSTALHIDPSQVVTQSLQAYQPTSFNANNEGSMLTIWLGYIPNQYVDELQAMLKAPQSAFYNQDNPIYTALGKTIDSSLPITTFSSQAHAAQQAAAVSASSDQSSPPVDQGQKMAVIASVTSCGAAMLAIGLFLVARQSKQNHKRGGAAFPGAGAGRNLRPFQISSPVIGTLRHSAGQSHSYGQGTRRQSEPLAQLQSFPSFPSLTAGMSVMAQHGGHGEMVQPEVRYEYGHARTTSNELPLGSQQNSHSRVRVDSRSSWWRFTSEDAVEDPEMQQHTDSMRYDTSRSASSSPPYRPNIGLRRSYGTVGFETHQRPANRRLQITRGADGLVSGIGRPVMKENSLFF